MKATTALLIPASLLFLAACDPVPEDSAQIRDRYLGHWTSACNSWVTSPVSGRVYCSSPWIPFSNEAAYAAVMPAKSDDSAYAGFDTKTPEEKKTLLIAQGEKVYSGNCQACHQAGGTGVAGSFPPLAGDPVANGGPVEEHILTVLNGLNGKAIGGVTYSGAMSPWRGALNDNQIAAVITYERNSWGNNGGIVEPSQVAALRK